MKIGIFLCASAILASGAAHAAVEGMQDCHLRQVASLDVTVTAHHRVLVPVTLSGSPFRMELKLSSGVSVIDHSIVVERKIKTYSLDSGIFEVYGGGGRVTELAAVDGLSLGGARYSRIDLLVGPHYSAAEEGVIGDIGMDMFGNLDLELDLPHRKLKLFSQDHCPGKVVYWSSTYSTAVMRRGDLGNVYFPVELEGRKIDAALATGLAETSLTTDVTRRLFGFDEHSAGVEKEVTQGETVLGQYRAMELTSSGFSVMNARIRLIPGSPNCSVIVGLGKDAGAAYKGCSGVVPLNLGMNVLEKLHIYIATRENMLYFTGPDVQSSN